jgi:hypothetical protein
MNMNTAAPALAETTPTPVIPRRIGLRLVLASIALVELIDGMSNAPVLLGDMSEIPGPGIGGAIIKAHLATHPVLALSALMFALIGYVRHAILALGAVILMTWLNYMPSLVLHGFDFAGPFAVVQTSTQIIVFPLMAACAIAYAARDQRPWLATSLVSIPTLFNLLSMVAFFVALVIYGF